MSGAGHADGGEVFDRLSTGGRADLADRGFGRTFFLSATPRLRRTVLNTFAKLSALGLWQFVGRNSGTTDGSLNFCCPDLEGLQAALARLGFTRPKGKRGFWESRERRAFCPVHVKHFVGWPVNRVQVHIDVFSATLKARWWAVPPLPAGLVVLHGLTQRSYLEQDLIARILLWQGFDPRLIA